MLIHSPRDCHSSDQPAAPCPIWRGELTLIPGGPEATPLPSPHHLQKLLPISSLEVSPVPQQARPAKSPRTLGRASPGRQAPEIHIAVPFCPVSTSGHSSHKLGGAARSKAQRDLGSYVSRITNVFAVGAAACAWGFLMVSP